MRRSLFPGVMSRYWSQNFNFFFQFPFERTSSFEDLFMIFKILNVVLFKHKTISFENARRSFSGQLLWCCGIHRTFLFLCFVMIFFCLFENSSHIMYIPQKLDNNEINFKLELKSKNRTCIRKVIKLLIPLNDWCSFCQGIIQQT